MKNFDEWLSERNRFSDHISSEWFIDCVKSHLKGVSYDIKSTTEQLRNGTLVLYIHDKDWIDEALKDFGIEESSFVSSSFDELYKYMMSNGSTNASSYASERTRYTRVDM